MSSTISRINRSAVTDELSNFTSKYKSGEIGTAEMRDFLAKITNNPAYTPEEVKQIESTISSMEIKITGERLQASYMSAEPGSIAQVQAARGLAQFYASQAASSSGDSLNAQTYSQYASQWGQQATNDQNALEKTNRNRLRATKEAEIAALPNNTSEESNQRAQMYVDLYNQAVADGDLDVAEGFRTKAIEANTRAQEIANKEQNSEIMVGVNKTIEDYQNGLVTREDVTNSINQAYGYASETGDIAMQNQLSNKFQSVEKFANTTSANEVNRIIKTAENDYLNGKITPEEYYTQLQLGDQKAMEMGDSSLQLTITKKVDTLNSQLEKQYEKERLNPTAKIPGRDGSEMVDIGTATESYQKNLREIFDYATKGKDKNGNAYTVNEFNQDYRNLVNNRINDINNSVQVLSQYDPAASIKIGIKNVKVADLLNDLDQEMNVDSAKQEGSKFIGNDGGLNTLSSQLQNNNVAFIVNPASESGPAHISTANANVSEFSDPNKWIKDEAGRLYPVKKETATQDITKLDAGAAAQIKRELDSGARASEVQTVDKDGNVTTKVYTRDLAGNYLTETGRRQVDVYDPNTQQKGTYILNDKSEVVDFIPPENQNNWLESYTGKKPTQVTSLSGLGPEYKIRPNMSTLAGEPALAPPIQTPVVKPVAPVVKPVSPPMPDTIPQGFRAQEPAAPKASTPSFNTQANQSMGLGTFFTPSPTYTSSLSSLSIPKITTPKITAPAPVKTYTPAPVAPKPVVQQPVQQDSWWKKFTQAPIKSIASWLGF